MLPRLFRTFLVYSFFQQNTCLASKSQTTGVLAQSVNLEIRHGTEVVTARSNLNSTRGTKPVAATNMAMVNAGAQDTV